MSRFIDAEFLDDIVDELNRNGYDISNTTLLRGKIILSHIPTADVVEAVRGEWKWTGSNNLRCSECGDIAPTSYNYCPNCGADMRGGTE